MKWLLLIPVLLILLLWLPVSVRIRYNSRLTVWAGVGPFRAQVYETPEEEAPPQKPQSEQKPPEKSKKKKKSPLTEQVDAAQAAVRAGRTNAAVYGIYLALGRIFTVDYPEILILPDFFREEDNLYAESRITLRPVALLAFGAGFAFRLVKRRQEHEQTNDSPGQTAGADPE